MKNIIYSLALGLLITPFLAACATIVSKTDYPITVSSKPDGADITIANRAGQSVFAGKTPATVVLKAGAAYFTGETYTVTFKRAGYVSHTAQIERGVNGWYIAGNIVFGGLIGWLIVDPITGAMWPSTTFM